MTWRGIVAVVGRPRLWVTALRQTKRLARPRWWARRPFVPVPDRDYLRFRLETQYGDPDHRPEPSDIVIYLEWCRRQHAAAGFR
ncbi:MAG TPA: hypothetical protein VGJ03_07670 [Acidimicrobiales bacterium]